MRLRLFHPRFRYLASVCILLMVVLPLASCLSIEPGADLSGKNLSGKDLSEAALSGADLSEADLSSTNLTGADLTNANLSGANLAGADLSYANLSGADLAEADLTGTRLRNADLSNTRLINAVLTNAYLLTADLTEADLTNANLSDTDLRSADLSNADLTGADLTNADLSRANLGDADLIHTNLSGADLIEAILTEADLNQADLTKADLQNADLVGANLEQADFTNANLNSANFTEANLSGAIFEEASLITVEGITVEMLASAASLTFWDFGSIVGQACFGEGIAEAASYGTSDITPIILVETDGPQGVRGHKWNENLPSDMQTRVIGEAELVVCISPTEEVIETCEYCSGLTFFCSEPAYTIDRLRNSLEVKVVEAQTGRIIDSQTIQGGLPGGCKDKEKFAIGDYHKDRYGSKVTFEQLMDWLETVIE